FFSSRRRHTRSDRDWSSDVCSSDLDRAPLRCARPPVPGDLGGHGPGARRAPAGRPAEAGSAQMGAGRKLGRVRRLVVKVGSGLVTEAGAGVAPDRVAALSAEIAGVREGRRVVLVTSGAIATG